VREHVGRRDLTDEEVLEGVAERIQGDERSAAAREF
jgi:hypothetical protein